MLNSSSIAELEKNNVPLVEAILAKKAENQALTPEEYVTLIQFVDRVERRTVEKLRAEAAVQEERLSEARAVIPPAAFDTGIDTLGLPEHVYTILTEAEHRTVGDLMLAMKLDPDSVLGLAGIGPKAMQAIEAALASVSWPEPEKPVEELPVEVVEEVQPGEIAPQEPVETVALPEVTPIVEEQPVTEPVVAAAEEPEEDKDFEKLFSMQNVVTGEVVVDESEDAASQKDKDKKKGRKDRVIEFDEDRGEAVARKKHKRGDGIVDQEW